MAGAAAQPAREAVALLDEYRRGDFFLSTAERTVLARGAGVVVEGHDPAELDRELDRVLADAPGSMAVGVLPFDADSAATPARLTVPQRLWTSEPAHEAVRQRAARAVPAPATVTPVPEPERHRAAVRRALDELHGDGSHADPLRKVVLARALDITFDIGIDPAVLLYNLVREHSTGFTFAADLPGERAVPRTLVGSSPELLVRRRGDRVIAHPHAGSAPRTGDPETDERHAAALLASAKDHAEHAMVIEAVVDALRPLCRNLDVPAAPALEATPTMWHLGTAITGELREDVSALRLAAALHPTPAVCGTPTAAARELVRELEPFDRAYYAGAIGWVDAAGDGEWVVSIRCAEVASRTLRLYAGGGIVAASEPEAELAETTAKFRTLLRAMGLSPEL
ncbi:isochorismate synthase [Haloechinothrix sp. LS1_15]|uniref:isochorismate synthase n=1 Tax=Haloechinothrix sp. LS1_15 TaxID=2652248 RepID=UPI0029479FD7|nr:isochorismate synthase [Haloechinothrix sp. LS1_15]MDV6014333.1 isochorismate synthase [Haloechinothrix sp. LS1_15]